MRKRLFGFLAAVAVITVSIPMNIPVSASTPGDSTWTIQKIPSITKNVLSGVSGSSVLGIAVGSDGKTVYAITPIPFGTPGSNEGYIMKSTDAGQGFDSVQNNYAVAGGNVPMAIAVAPDDINTVAVTDGAKVIISRDGGTTWSALAAPVLAAGEVIADIAIAPARPGTILGREYVIATANTNPGAFGDVKIIGGNATWATVGGASPANLITFVFDFTSVVVSPNFLGDRCVVAVGTKATAGSTALLIVNTSTNTVIVGAGFPVIGTPLLPTSNTVGIGDGATAIINSSIALPSDFNPSLPAGRRAYVGIASAGAQNDNDVYRVDDNIAAPLGAVSATPVWSVAYSGTINTGKLFMAPMSTLSSPAADVKYSSNMTLISPTWTTTLKGPTGAPSAQRPVLKVAANYATTGRVFAGTRGLESAFSISNDAGVSFVQEALVSVTGLGSPSLTFTPDATTAFLSAKDTNNYGTVWQSSVPFDATSWKRIFVSRAPFTGSSSLKISPAWATTPALFFFEVDTLNGQVYTSQDGGVSWTTRNGPAGVSYANAVARDAQTLYYCDTNVAGNVYKSTDGAQTWGSAVSAGVGKINSINLPKANKIVVAGASVAISNDDAATFTTMNNGLPDGTTYSLTADSAYATNNIIYTADTTQVSYNIYRVKTDVTSNAWEKMAATVGTPGRILGITCRSGILYATTNVIADGVLRTLYPIGLIGTQNWQRLNGGYNPLPTAPATGVTTTAGINLYARVATSNTIYAFNDYLATNKPVLSYPADNFVAGVNPLSGTIYPLTLKWQPLGQNTGLVDGVDIEIADKANGFTGYPTFSNVVVAPQNPYYTVMGYYFIPNHSYIWRVRAAHVVSGQAIDSPWSDLRTLIVGPPDPVPLSITTSVLPVGKVGSAYLTYLMAAGGTPPYSWSVPASGSGALPTGLSLNANTGVISGSPLAPGTASVVITLTDAAQASRSVSLPLTVIPQTYLPVSLTAGWNTFSTPVSLETGFNTMAVVFSGANFDIAYGFNSQTQLWTGLTAGSTINPCDAVYIHMLAPFTASLKMNPVLTPPPSKNLFPGWNIVSLANFVAMPANEGLTSVDQVAGGTGYTQAVSQSLGNQASWAYLKGQSVSNQYLQPYFGYWVFMVNGGTLAGFTTTP
jgi:hypothetical protein